MYPCSNAFHEAVANGNEQKAMLIFPDCVFTDEDINVEDGIRFNDYFNAEEDLCIGQATSNEISFGLFNDDRLLNDYTFGDFLATLGVKINESAYQQFGSVTVYTKYATYVGSGNYPFILRNNVQMNPQPSFPVMCIMAYDDKVYCFGSNGQWVAYNDKNGANITGSVKVHSFLQNKAKGLAGKGYYYNKDSRILNIYDDGIHEYYEFVPLGWFTAERPKAPDVIQIDLTCYDFMQKLEDDMPSNADLKISWPITIGGLFSAICTYVGVTPKSTTFINSTATITKRPSEFDHATMRDVIKWIAEAAGSNARFDRDGKLALEWLRETGQTYDATGYSDFNPAWYRTRKVTQLCNRNTQDVVDKKVGSGKETYLIQDNPLLRGVS